MSLIICIAIFLASSSGAATVTIPSSLTSTFAPDFCPIRLNSDPWIVQPTEHYEDLSIEEILKQNK